jgi:hypothetical protein
MAKPIAKLFHIRHGVLVRTVVPRRGKPYVQRCDLESFAEVAYLIDDLVGERDDRSLTTPKMWENLPNVPHTQASVALDFLKERGVVRVEGRRSYPASNVPFEDALCEWHALDHESQTEN